MSESAQDRTDHVIELRGVAKAYGEKRVLTDATLAIRRGEVLVIMGGSGTGKSVTIRHMLGLEQPDAGEVYVDGEEISSYGESQLYSVRMKFGMLFQSGGLFDSMTVFDNVAFPLREHTDTSDEELERRVEEALEMVQLPGSGKLMPVDLSGGMRKRVGLARAIVHRPEVILYDEPTTGLDPITADKINELIVNLQRQLDVTSIVVTHDIQSAFYVGDRIAFLNNGLFEWVGTMDEAKSAEHPVLREFLTTSNVALGRAANG